MKLKIPQLFSQRDPVWASIPLGYNAPTAKDALGHFYNIYWYGCLITSFSMYINDQPNNVNQKLKDNGGFVDKSGDFIWSKSTVLGLTQTYISPRYTGPVTSQGITKIKELLDQGYPLICEIDFNPATNGEEMHFILICGYDGDKIYAADPWTGQIIDLDVYGGPARAIIQFRAYDKKLDKDEVTVAVPSSTFETLVKKSTAYDNFFNAGYKTLEDVAKAIEEERSKLNAVDAYKKALQGVLSVGDTDWQGIVDATSQAIKDRDDTLRQAEIGDHLWDKIVKDSGVTAVKYTDDGLTAVMGGIDLLKNTVPEGFIKLKDEDYQLLLAKKTLDKFNKWELLGEAIKKMFGL